MIYLTTGTPGAGKSLELVEVILRRVSEGRRVWVYGLNGLDTSNERFAGAVKVMEDNPFELDDSDRPRWQTLPDGAVLVVDEAWKVLPVRPQRQAPPRAIGLLAEHRHKGYDIHLASQDPKQLDTFVRGLVTEHRHLMRRYGTAYVDVVTWQACIASPNSVQERSRGFASSKMHDKALFGLYKSATLHTAKAKVPWQIIAIPGTLVAVVGLGWWAWNGLWSKTTPGGEEEAPAVVPAESRQALGGDYREHSRSDRDHVMTAEEWITHWTPRIQGIPWSAPAFDGIEARQPPSVYCMLIHRESVDCRCYTEQATRVQVDRLSCVRIANDGIWHPHRQMQHTVAGGVSTQRQSIGETGPSELEIGDQSEGASSGDIIPRIPAIR
jgi:zona occludens toxin